MSLTAMDGCRIPTEVTRRLVAPGFPCTSDLPQQKSSKCAEACTAMEPPSRPGTQPSGDVSRVLTRGPPAWHSEQKGTVKWLPVCFGHLVPPRLADTGGQPSAVFSTVPPKTKPPQNTTAAA